TWSYNNNDSLYQQIMPDGLTTTYSYLANDFVSDIKTTRTTGGATVAEFGPITYDGANNIKSLIATTSGVTKSTVYQYDALDRLTNESTSQGSGANNNYSHDQANNANIRGSSNTFNLNNQIVGLNYDGAGNQTNDVGNTLGYDKDNNLTSYGSSITAGYGADGQRAWKQVVGSANKTFYLYDGSAPVCEMDSSGAPHSTSTYGLVGLVSRATDAGDIYYNFDAQGNTAQRVDGNGNVLTNHAFDAYGKQLTTDTTGDPYVGIGAQFGNYKDVETGLSLMSSRYYNPTTGRFINRDPIGYAGGPNLYSYADGNPSNRVDPDGTCPLLIPVVAGLAGAAYGAWKAHQDGTDMWVGAAKYGAVGFVAGGVGMLAGAAVLGAVGESCVGYILAGAADGVASNLTQQGISLMAGWQCQFNPWETLTAGALGGIGGKVSAMFKGLGCFVAGTPVQMADGSTKAIEKVKVGDLVISRDEKTGKTKAKRVTDTIVHEKVPTIALHFQNGETIVTTAPHPFYVKGKGFVNAGDLAVGNAIVTRAGPRVKIIGIEHLAEAKVYNFTVDGYHTYFIGHKSGGYWVHNTILCLNYKPGWTPLQIAEANAKVAALDILAKAGVLVKSIATRVGTRQDRIWRNAGNTVPPGYQVDHIHEIQLGGANVIGNLAILDGSVNGSIGSQIMHRISGLNYGDVIRGVTISW
ncbi:MAG: polymorphic toxin-type HINT domain-containing protein, partial [Capsulimonas sp.]|uniref:polymorphic toxin-type HINT domain-containing protein n=1 Tax=Capsulimonas sp. TaxID=2494211 RepID=UPI003262ECB8